MLFARLVEIVQTMRLRLTNMIPMRHRFPDDGQTVLDGFTRTTRFGRRRCGFAAHRMRFACFFAVGNFYQLISIKSILI